MWIAVEVTVWDHTSLLASSDLLKRLELVEIITKNLQRRVATDDQKIILKIYKRTVACKLKNINVFCILQWDKKCLKSFSRLKRH